MTNENTENKDDKVLEPIVLSETEFESLLIGCVWDVLKRMRLVSMRQLNVEQATEEDDAVGRHLARTLMGENDGFDVKLPYVGSALVEMLQRDHAAYYGPDALPSEIDKNNPRSVLVYVCRDFVQGIYRMVQEIGTREELTTQMLDREVRSLAAFWACRFMGRTEKTLN